MKTIRKIYGGFDRMIADDRRRGWNTVFWIHFWILLAIASVTIWHRPLEGILWFAVTVYAYCLEIQGLELKETRAELARLKADRI